jgi:trimeric autotransporter adhesin
MKLKLFLSLIFILLSLFIVNCFSQGISINTSGISADASAMLDINSSSKGLLIPRVSLASTTDVSAVPSPAVSLLVYNTNGSMSGGGAGYWYWNGSQWTSLTGTQGTVSGVQYNVSSPQATANNGNYLFNVDYPFGGATNCPGARIRAYNGSGYSTATGLTVIGEDGGGWGSATGLSVSANTGGYLSSSYGVIISATSGQVNNIGLQVSVSGGTANYAALFKSGNVGIGTSTPSALLEVDGASGNTVKIVDGNQGTGKVLTSDANGNGSWQTPGGGGGSGWLLTGNGSTTPGTNFMGTTDDKDVVFKRFNVQSGLLNSSSGNTTWGVGSLNSNTSGYHNTSIGNQTLYSNKTGFENTAVGYQALYSNTGDQGQGFGNTAVGYNSLYANTIGYENTATGWNSMSGNTTGQYNTANGYQALQLNQTGWYNTALGQQSLWSNKASGNTATGYQSLYSYTTGSNNTANGYYALYGTFGNSTASNNTALGAMAMFQTGTGSNNTACGENALSTNISGSDNTVLGYNAGSGTSGVNFNQCTFIGDNSTPTHSRTNVTMLGYGIADGQCTADNQLLLGNTSVTQIRAQIAGITAYSDKRFKTNIKENVAGLNFIMKLKPVTYNVRPKQLHRIWGTADSLISKMDFSDAEKQTQIGFIAQEVEKAAKECGFTFPGIDIPQNDKEVYSLRYVDFIMPMVKALQEMNESLKNNVQILKSENANLKAEIESQKEDIDKIKEHLGLEARK